MWQDDGARPHVAARSAAGSAGCRAPAASSRGCSPRPSTPTSATSPSRGRRPRSRGAATTAPAGSGSSGTARASGSSPASPAPTATRTSRSRRRSRPGCTASRTSIEPPPMLVGNAYEAPDIPHVPWNIVDAIAEFEQQRGRGRGVRRRRAPPPREHRAAGVGRRSTRRSPTGSCAATSSSSEVSRASRSSRSPRTRCDAGSGRGLASTPASRCPSRYVAALQARRRRRRRSCMPDGDRRRSTPTSCSTTSTACCCSAAPTSTRRPTAPEPDPHVYGVNARRATSFELALDAGRDRARACRRSRSVAARRCSNVALGGIARPAHHRARRAARARHPRRRGRRALHDARASSPAPGSPTAMGTTHAECSSHHHQAVDRLGDGPAASPRARPTAIVEGIELDGDAVDRRRAVAPRGHRRHRPAAPGAVRHLRPRGRPDSG